MGGEGDEPVKGRPAATARAVVCPLLRTAEDAARGLIARGGPDLRGEKRGGDASRAEGGGAMPASTRSAGCSSGGPGPGPRRAGRKHGPTVAVGVEGSRWSGLFRG